ncbi:hypothetical protein EK21DRAFT_70354 [Setomelanomma holmii]|uniref:Uncharacterized protein n=1 Tax=Setomelanomma holmii TaxID=210430 RepID=A0A9P4LIM6_9PLEO|nr:hypothetical protein EK21DRAFT_70354 [Setomelanomma holmii]
MHVSFVYLFVLSAFTAAQTYPECTKELVRTDDCAAVIDANACYNKFRWNAQTLMCIDGTDDTEKQRKVCKCCSCVGEVMCDWATKQKFC